MPDSQANYLQVVRNCKRNLTTIIMFWINFLKRVSTLNIYKVWKSESKIWQSVRSGIKNLQSVRIRIRTSHPVNFRIQFLSAWQISKPKSSICQISNRKFHNVAAAESKSLCARFRIKKSTTCQIWNQTIQKNMSYINRKCW